MVAATLERTVLSPTTRKFILHWGEMGTRWGINRTVAQVHALLYISPEPIPADVIAETLSVARSNVSGALRELQGWGIVKVAPVLGQRKDHFITTTDVWEMFQIILDERKRREIDPTLELLKACVEEVKADSKGDPVQTHIHQRLSELYSLLHTLSGWYGQIRAMPTGAVIKFVKMGSKVGKLLGVDTGSKR